MRMLLSCSCIPSVRNAFTTPYSSYAIYFKNTDAALSNYVQGEVVGPHPPHLQSYQSNLAFTATVAVVGVPASPPFVDTFPLLPPPLPSFSNSPLYRGSRGKRGVVENDHNLDAPAPVSSPAPLVSMESWTAYDFYFSVEKMSALTLVDAEEIERKVYDERLPTRVESIEEEEAFEESPKRVENDEEEDVERSPKVEEVVAVPPPLVASESAHDVSKMLEATRLHYHSNFADNRGHINHSPRVMRVITWNRSFRGLLNVDDSKDDFNSEEHETHGTILDKLLAWEKKLYYEVKTCELMKYENQKKVTSLNTLNKRGTNSEALEKAKVAVSHLHFVLIVTAFRSLDIFQCPKHTSEHHHECTIQLFGVYIKALNNWLKLNLIPIEKTSR
ncbi:hypothetical protein D8674_041723 [Pyrus ussuriensis x Pyrus communis]|uniref:DUF632 domain-containing protein n=1 Tax=Pyrus ussuriensis x Pyrus communis TaxID=2448454 RepID=A0A5N5GXK2_9ROSA|nr:hypothetical protein D8674_041723 [Pyrus ussuriensis x Pyrus communis]